MGWERRKGRLFYYRKQWNGGQVCSIYMGRGQKAIEASRAEGVLVPGEVVLGAEALNPPEQEKAESASITAEKQAEEPSIEPSIKWRRYTKPEKRKQPYRYRSIYRK